MISHLYFPPGLIIIKLSRSSTIPFSMFADPADLAELAACAFDEVLSRTLQEATSHTEEDANNNKKDGRSGADLLLLLGDNNNSSSPSSSSSVLSPWEYRFAYLTVFGTMPSEADIQMVYELDGGRGLLNTPTVRSPSHPLQPPTSLLQDKLSYLSSLSHYPPSQQHTPISTMTRDRFIRRMHDKHVALYGPFEHGSSGKATKMPLLWSVFDSVDVNAKGYITIDDLRRAAYNVIGVEGGDQSALDRMVGMCEQSFMVADEDRDGRVYFDRFEWMATQV